jgi:hypothetical protein
LTPKHSNSTNIPTPTKNLEQSFLKIKKKIKIKKIQNSREKQKNPSPQKAPPPKKKEKEVQRWWRVAPKALFIKINEIK